MFPFDPRLLGRIHSGNAKEPSDALAALVAQGAAKDPGVVAAVEDRIRAGGFFTQYVLVRWILAAAPVSTNVFNGQGGYLRKSPSAELELLKLQSSAAREPERAALDLLDEYGTEPGRTYRPQLFDALRNCESRARLPWLKSLQVDLRAQARLRRDVVWQRPSQICSTPISRSCLCERGCADKNRNAVVGMRSGTVPPAIRLRCGYMHKPLRYRRRYSRTTASRTTASGSSQWVA